MRLLDERNTLRLSRLKSLALCLLVFLVACSEEEPATDEEAARDGMESASSAGEDEIHNEYEGAYRLQSAFRGEQECLDANYHDANTDHGGAFMAPCSGADDQAWQFEPLDSHHYQIWTEHDGERLCLDGNDRDSKIHDGAAFVEPCRPIVGQVWSINPEQNGFVRLHTEYRQHAACLESNQADSPAHSGASYMDECQNVSGQIWQLVRMDAPPS